MSDGVDVRGDVDDGAAIQAIAQLGDDVRALVTQYASGALPLAVLLHLDRCAVACEQARALL